MRGRIGDDQVVELAEMFRLMSDPTRLSIILACLDAPASVGEMAERIGISGSLVSHHLRLLLHDLADLGYVSVRETYFHDTVGHEFFLNLSVDGPGPGLSRAELVALADDERRSTDRPRFREAEGSVEEAALPAGLDGDLH